MDDEDDDRGKSSPTLTPRSDQNMLRPRIKRGKGNKNHGEKEERKEEKKEEKARKKAEKEEKKMEKMARKLHFLEELKRMCPEDATGPNPMCPETKVELPSPPGPPAPKGRPKGPPTGPPGEAGSEVFNFLGGRA